MYIYNNNKTAENAIIGENDVKKNIFFYSNLKKNIV